MDRVNKILLIEDVEADAELIALQLKRAGIIPDLQIISTSEELKESLKLPPDLILSDYNLPGFTGMDALKIARKRLPDVPFILISGVIGEEQAVEAMREGAADYVLKGRMDRLGPAVMRELEGAEKRRYDRIIQMVRMRTEEVSGVASWEYDVRSGNVLQTPKAYELYNLPANKEMTLEMNREIYDERSLELIDEELDRAIKEGKPYQMDLTLTGKGREGRIIRVHGYPWIEDGEVTTLFGTLEDVTDKIEREAELKRLVAELKESAEELAVSNAELEQFAYIASHDLQEPLRMVSSFLTQLEKKYGDLLDEKGKQYIHFAVDGAARMRSIILDLLEYSRVGQRQYELTEVDTEKMVKELVQQFSSHLKESGGKVIVGNLPVIRSAFTPLQQVFRNLIGNAIKYHEKGIQPIVQVRAERKRREWLFLISDNGMGIDPRYHLKVFEMFQRLHPREHYSGTGIGLAICKKVIENQGGRIWVESEEGKGSTFFFILPDMEKSR